MKRLLRGLLTAVGILPVSPKVVVCESSESADEFVWGARIKVRRDGACVIVTRFYCDDYEAMHAFDSCKAGVLRKGCGEITITREGRSA